jgi:hypothetical protein
MTYLPKLLAFCLLAMAGAATTADAANKCAGAKIKATGKGASCLVKLDAKEAKTGAAPDPLKLQACRDKLALAFGKAEAKPPCITNGDAAPIQTRVDTFVSDLDLALSVGFPSKCQASKLKAAAKGEYCLL